MISPVAVVVLILSLLPAPEVCNAERCWSIVGGGIDERNRQTGVLLQRWITGDIGAVMLTVSRSGRYVVAVNPAECRWAVVDRVLVVVRLEDGGADDCQTPERSTSVTTDTPTTGSRHFPR